MRGYYKKVSRLATASDLYCDCVRIKPKARRQLKRISSKSIRKALDKITEW